MIRKVLLAGLVGLAVLVVSSTQLLAAPGGNSNGQSNKNGGGGSGTINVPDGTFGETTTATVNPGGEQTYVKNRCYQDDSLVLVQYQRVDENNEAVLGLGPTELWTSGSAVCIAEEGYFQKSGKWHPVASTTFNVAS